MDFSPKADFAKGPRATQWTDVATSALFREAAGVAMLDMQQRQLVSLGEGAAANYYRMEGARTFLSTLLNLTTPPAETPKRPQSENLRHDI